MLGVHAFIPEDAADLVDSVDATDDEALQIELGLDAQDHVDVQGIVVGVEGTG